MGKVPIYSGSVGFASAADGVITSNSDSLSVTNNAAQVAATSAGFYASINPFAAGTAVVAGLGAATTQAAQFIQDAQNPQVSGKQLINEGATFVGDLAIAGGALAEASGFEGAGQVFTALGTAAAAFSLGTTDGQALKNSINNAVSSLESYSSSVFNAIVDGLVKSEGTIDDLDRPSPDIQDPIENTYATLNDDFQPIATSVGAQYIAFVDGQNANETIPATAGAYVTVIDPGAQIHVQDSGATIDFAPKTEGTVDVAANLTGIAIYGSGSTVQENATDTVSVYGNTNTVDISGIANLTLNGTGNIVNAPESVQGTSVTGIVDIDGSGSSATIESSTQSNVYITASNQSLDASNQIVHIAAGLTGIIIDGYSNYLVEASDDKATVDGRYNEIDGNASDETDLNGTSGYGSFDDADGFYTSGGPPGPDDGYGGAGGYDGGGGDGDYGGYDIVAASKNSSGAADLHIIALHDQALGDDLGAASAIKARNQASLALQAFGTAGAAATAVFEGPKWVSGQDDSAAPVITWSFAENSNTAGQSSGYINQQYREDIESSITAWAKASGLRFEELANGSASDLNIGWGNFDTAESGVLGYTSFKGSDGAIQPGAVVRLENPSETPLSSEAANTTYAGTDTTLYQLALHEIGHALGLADDADPTSIMFASTSSQNRGLDATDVAGIRALYNETTQQSDTLTSSASANPRVSFLGETHPALGSDRGLNQMIQAMASFRPQSPALAMPSIAAQSASLAQTLAAPLH